MAKVMGIDYGAKRVGIALSDAAGQFAFPKTVLPNDEGLLDAIAGMVEREQVDRLVVGEADNPAGGENTIMRRVLIFKEALEVRTELPVETETEAYSSAEARRVFEEKLASRKEGRTQVDAAAASIILQTHLDRIAANKKTS
jgi:putative Holliday junction resolvase